MNEDAALQAIEQAMIRIRRSQSRRALSRLSPEADPAVFAVLDALEEIGRPGTVGELGTALGVDQPRASRLAARAVDEGLLVRQADQQDGRRTRLALTDRARDHLAAAHRTRQEVFDRVMTDWPAADRVTFARLLTSFTDALGTLATSAGGAEHRPTGATPPDQQHDQPNQGEEGQPEPHPGEPPAQRVRQPDRRQEAQ